MSATGELVKLKIIAYSKPEQGDGDKKGEFEAYFNPATITSAYTVKYKDDQRQGASLFSLYYDGYEPSAHSFELLLDGTGAAGPKIDVPAKIKEFMDLAYTFQGEEHKANYLLVSWGEAIALKCVLQSVNITYDLFSPGGKPLRAKMATQFKEYSYEDLTKAKENKQSPDITHQRTVRQGDTLPLMCQRIYGDSRLYLEVARANDLTDFRDLTPGSQLFFPPLVNRKG
ncbi:MAG: hypothetical protein AAGN35_08465 [Bacteroidota bacterium]